MYMLIWFVSYFEKQIINFLKKCHDPNCCKWNYVSYRRIKFLNGRFYKFIDDYGYYDSKLCKLSYDGQSLNVLLFFQTPGGTIFK